MHGEIFFFIEKYILSVWVKVKHMFYRIIGIFEDISGMEKISIQCSEK